MEQLELRSYPRQEIAQITDRKPSSSHFARDVKDTLDKWGYEYDYRHGGAVTITRKPTSAKERLKELMIRQFGMDIQVEVSAFACFILLLLSDDEFKSMPWAEREAILLETCGLEVAESTLRKWAATLIHHNVLDKDKYGRVDYVWRTRKHDGNSYRDQIPDDDAEYTAYKDRRRELVQVYQENGLSRAEAWSKAFKQLWGEYGCCYYRCPSFTLNAIGHDIDEIIEWAAEIMEDRYN